MSESYISFSHVNVDIPLRGVSNFDKGSDQRFFQDRKGNYFLRALTDINLQIKKGDRIGVLGGNGNGKSTLLKAIAGILPVTKGELKVKGSVRALLSLGSGLPSSLTGRHLIKINYKLLGIKNVSFQEYEDSVLDFAEIGSFIDMPTSIYSPGMNSRLLFAMNTVEGADILLLDEWIGVADAKFQKKANDRLVKLVTSNEIFLFASHNNELIDSMTDKKINLNNGRIVL